MHVGSIYGLAPLSSIPQDKQFAFNKWVITCWEDLCKKFFNPDYLLLGGDLTDGSDVKALGVGAITTNLDEQENMAVTLLNMLIGKDTKVYGVNGSGHHCGEGQATDLDRRITEALHGTYKHVKFEFDIGEEKIQLAHGGGSGINLSSYIIKELEKSKLLAQKRKTKSPTILLRGHQHRFFAVQDDCDCWGILNGCWKFPDSFVLKKSTNIGWDIGATIIDIEDGVAKVYRQRYDLPDDVIQAMEGFEELQETIIKEKKKKDKEEWDKLNRETYCKDSKGVN